jgi:hypothetical protein
MALFSGWMEEWMNEFAPTKDCLFCTSQLQSQFGVSGSGCLGGVVVGCLVT